MAEEEIRCPLSDRELIDRIVLFCETLSEVALYTYQSLFCRRVVESVIGNEGSNITGLWSRQSGKTETVACVCLGLSVLLPALAKAFPDDPRLKPYHKGFSVGVYAPVKDQAEISFGRMRNKVHSEYGEGILHDPEIGVEVVTSRGDTLSFSNGSTIIARTASPDTQIEGKTHHLIICEEAQKLSRTKVEKEIRPMAASTNGTFVTIGTAWESRGGFHQSIQKNVDVHKTGGKRSHFEFGWDIVCDEKKRAFQKDKNPFHLNYEKFVQGEIFRLGGTDSPEFQMNFECKWQESRAIAISKNVFKDAALNDVESGPFTQTGFQVAGLDIGKTNDATVLTILDVDMQRPIRNPYVLGDANEDKQLYYPKIVVDWVELMGSFEGHSGQYAMLVDYLARTNVKVMVIDATSMGDPVYERIEAMIGGSIICVPYKFSSISKSNLYKYYLQELNSGRVKYAAGPTTRQRHEFRKFTQENLDLDRIDYGSYAVCQAPEGGHDDYPDSAALACWAEKIAGDVALPEIKVESASTVFGGHGRRGRGQSEGSVTVSGGRGSRYARRG